MLFCLSINGDNYVLDGDEDGIIIDGNDISGLDANASLTVGSAGTYDVNGVELDAKIGDVIISDDDGQISIYNEDDYNVDENTSTEELVDKFFKFAERKQKQYEHGLISKAEYDEFRRTPPSEHIRNYGFTWAE